MKTVSKRNRIDERLRGRKNLFIGYITGGDPTLTHTEEMVYAMERGGADLVEIGIPYSDPLADGPTIQRAAGRALKEGFSMEALFDSVVKIRKNTDLPLVFLVYYNTIHTYGVEAFAKRCRTSGIDAFIVPDLPLEESRNFPQDIVPLIPLIALNSQERIGEIVKERSGFVYCISSFGVTGSRSSISDKTRALVERVKSHTDLPVAVGFGISTREMVEEVHEYADAAIVGSSIVRVVEESKGNPERVEAFVRELTGR